MQEALSTALAAAARRDYGAVVDLLGPVRSASCEPRILGELGYAYYMLARFSESASCWEALLGRDTPPRVRGKLQSNLARASYRAAEAAARSGRYTEAVRHQRTYCGYYPGDQDSSRVLERLARIVELREAAADLEEAKRLLASGRWLDAADALTAVSVKVGELDPADS
jgi:tetratricopeptide (TPR) repeat protein